MSQEEKVVATAGEKSLHLFVLGQVSTNTPGSSVKTSLDCHEIRNVLRIPPHWMFYLIREFWNTPKDFLTHFEKMANYQQSNSDECCMRLKSDIDGDFCDGVSKSEGIYRDCGNDVIRWIRTTAGEDGEGPTILNIEITYDDPEVVSDCMRFDETNQDAIKVAAIYTCFAMFIRVATFCKKLRGFMKNYEFTEEMLIEIQNVLGNSD